MNVASLLSKQFVACEKLGIPVQVEIPSLPVQQLELAITLAAQIADKVISPSNRSEISEGNFRSSEPKPTIKQLNYINGLKVKAANINRMDLVRRQAKTIGEAKTLIEDLLRSVPR